MYCSEGQIRELRRGAQSIFCISSKILTPIRYLNWVADLTYFMLTLQELWAVQWVWPITTYVFILHSEIWTKLSYDGHAPPIV